MKVLFAGPSLYGADWSAEPDRDLATVQRRGPAAQGDIARAVLEGATVIGLIDGRYEDVAAPWHKEILFAIENGAQVYGAASMGALRAAECDSFGMIGVGAVYERYRSGELQDDAAVAQLHAPEELGYLPLSEALVNVEATIARFQQLKAISEDEAQRLDDAARKLFFKERTYPRILAAAGLNAGERGKQLSALVKRCRVDQKRDDALILFAYMAYLEPVRNAPPKDWRMESTHTFNLTLKRARKFVGAPPGDPLAA